MHKASCNTGGSEKSTQLRLDAENRLKNGTAPLTKGWTLSADALTILFKLASKPESASEGLKLLHELQAHQVELDLQHEQLEANERQFAEELARYKSLYESAPTGYFTLNLDGQIIESNLAGAQLFGARQDQLAGQRIEHFLSPECRGTVSSLLGKLHFESTGTSCEVRTHDSGDGSRRLRIHANVSPSGEAVLMVVSAQD
ncbi:MAG: PAS domain S-box protein [Ketobacter sp.]|nr:PAS domain S-box protein [Ketobacter sp.]